MNIRVLDIQIPEADPAAAFGVRVEMDVDGAHEWFTFRVEPLGMPRSDTRIIEAGRPFLDRFRDHRRAVHHVRRLVGQAVQQGKVHLPQLIAA